MDDMTIKPAHTVWIDLPGEDAVELPVVGPDDNGPTMLLHWSGNGVAALHLGEPYETPDGRSARNGQSIKPWE